MELLLILIGSVIFYVLSRRPLKKEDIYRRQEVAYEKERKEAQHIEYLLRQVNIWQHEGLIDNQTAEKLRERYLLAEQPVLAERPIIDNQQPPSVDPAPVFQPIPVVETPSFVKEQEPSQKEKKPVFDLMNFLREKNIKWFNALGTIMLLASGIIFVTSNWYAWNGIVKSIVMVLVTGLFFVGGYLIKNKLELASSGFAFYLVGALFVPLDLIAFNNFAVFGRTFNWDGFLSSTALITMVFYGFMVYKLKSQVFTGLASLAGGAALFQFLTYLGLGYGRAGIYFVPLSFLYFIIYYLLTRSSEEYKKTLFPLTVAANVAAAAAIGMAAVEKLGFALLTTSIIGSFSYLISTYLFKRLEYLYVFLGLMILSVFPGVEYYQLPGRAYNLSFIVIAGIALFLSYINRRINNQLFEKNFFYGMLGVSFLAGYWVLANQINLFSTPAKYNPELLGGFLTMFGGAVIYSLSAWMYNKKQFTYVGIVSFAVGYAMAIMWFGISAKLYPVFFLALSVILLALGKFVKDRDIWGSPLYLSGIVSNILVTLLLLALMVSFPQIFTKHDANLLAAIIALKLNVVVYFYLAFDNRELQYSYVGSAVFALAYTVAAVYIGLTWRQFGLYFTGLVGIYFVAEYLLGSREYYQKPFKYSGIIANFGPVLYYLLLFSLDGLQQLLAYGRFTSLFTKHSLDMLLVLLTFVIVSGFFVHTTGRFKIKEFVYGATSLMYFTFILFFNWLGLHKTYTSSLLSLVVLLFLVLSRLLSSRILYAQPLRYSLAGSNVVSTLLILLLAHETNALQYAVLTVSLLASAAVYFYCAYQWKSPVFTWLGFVPLVFADIKFIQWFKIDPGLNYTGLIIILFGLFLIGAGVLLQRKKLEYYYKPMFLAGYGLSVFAVAIGFHNAKTLIYPAFLATVLYAGTTYFTPVFREWFWRTTLITANITFGSVVYLINPDYTPATYVKYFVVFNLLKFGLGFYFQYFEKKMDFAWSNYGGVIITSLGSLAITFVDGDNQSIALVWLVYGLLYFALAWLLNKQVATYASALVITGGIFFLLDFLQVGYSHIGLYIAALSFLWIWVNSALSKHDVYSVPMRIIVPLSIGIPLYYNLYHGYDVIIIGSLIAAGALFAQGKLQGLTPYYLAAPLVLILGYEAFLLKYEVNFIELYIAPVSAYLIVVAFIWQKYNILSYVGLVALLGSSYLNSFEGDRYLLHALILGILSMASIIFGAATKHKGFFFLGIIFLLGDVVTQSRSYWMSLHKWFWIGLGGSVFLALGLMFDKKRKERTMQLINEQVDRFKMWS